MKLKVEPGREMVTIREYPVPRPVKRKRIPAGEIVELVENLTPPALRTRAGELIFVSAADKDALLEFARVNGIPVVRRVDVWSIILEVFLDTEFTDDLSERCDNELARCGIDRRTCDEIRA